MINKPLMKEMIQKQAAHRPVEISDEQIDSLIDEAEEVWNTTHLFMNSTSIEQRVIGAFIAGALFGLDKCDRKKEDLIFSFKR